MEDLKKLSIKELRHQAQSSAPEAGRDPYVGLTIRFFSIYITKFLLRTKISANQVTIISVLFFLAGATLFIFNIYWLYFLGCFLIYFSVVLDGCDGEIARLKVQKRRVGGIYTEPVSHDVQYALMFIPLTISAYLMGNSVLIIYIGFVATISKLLFRFIDVRFAKLVFFRKLDINPAVMQGNAHLVEFKRDVSLLHRLYRFLNRNIFSSVGLVVPLLIASLFNRIDLFIWLFAAFFGFAFLIKFLGQVQLIRKFHK